MEVFDHVVDVNVRGIWNGPHAALPQLQEWGSGEGLTLDGGFSTS